jgi:hypothetical protein
VVSFVSIQFEIRLRPRVRMLSWAEADLSGWEYRMRGICCLPIALFLGGCSGLPEGVRPVFTSSDQYQGHSCKRLFADAVRLSKQSAVLSGMPSYEKAEAPPRTLESVRLFLPKSTLIVDGQSATEFALIKDQLVAIKKASAEKGCIMETGGVGE